MALEMLELPHDVVGLALNLDADNVGAGAVRRREEVVGGDTVKRTNKLLEIPVGGCSAASSTRSAARSTTRAT